METTTYRDAIDNLLDYAGNFAIGLPHRDIKRAVRNAYEGLTQDHKWNYYRQQIGIDTVASEQGTTLTYVHSTRTATLTGADTWPTWAASGAVQVGGVTGEIISRTSATVVVLAEDNALAEDISTASAYTVFQDQYPLPSGVRDIGDPVNENYGWLAHYVDPEIWMQRRSYDANTGQPSMYTIKQSAELIGRMSICFYPAPDAVRSYELMSTAAPRELIVTGTAANDTVGTIAISDATTSITGTTTQFSSSMVGAILRFGDTTKVPTGRIGDNPYVSQHVIASVTNATTLTLETAVTQAFTGVMYSISDPIDVDPNMLPAFEHRCRLELICQRPKDLGKFLPVAERAYEAALAAARRVDGKSNALKVSGGTPGHYRRLSTFPAGADIE